MNPPVYSPKTVNPKPSVCNGSNYKVKRGHYYHKNSNMATSREVEVGVIEKGSRTSRLLDLLYIFLPQ